ncbi:hypothetical protein BKA70DRAFT_1431311 [Coprinopsis sp. MPI-PUGE-AT-0042]|nr:hypothetical protein BKA70DRAFT_1522203 [Coprinopsis sp. MPI-PUGE-AT-0042]KAH6905221.1 hypothetical protein BKA70DRAFT_1431311 [Coprinopsis sp. MPI-PUGE-AT-0042]
MEHPPEDFLVTLASELSSDEEIKQDPSEARWNETLNVLTSLVNTPKAITIDEAVHNINNHFITHAMGGEKGRAIDAKQADHFTWAFWFYLVNVAIQIPDGHPAQDQLVSLIKGLHDLPDPVEYTPEGDPTAQRMWVDLPGLASAIYEALRDSDRYTLGLEELAARLLQEADCDIKYFALIRINGVLERPETAPKAKKGVKKRPVVVLPIDHAIHHMEIWVGIAGQKLYQACQRNTKNKGEVALDNTSPGLTVALWNSWKSRVREIRMDTTEPNDRREIAERIEALMIAREEDGTEL